MLQCFTADFLPGHEASADIHLLACAYIYKNVCTGKCGNCKLRNNIYLSSTVLLEDIAAPKRGRNFKQFRRSEGLLRQEMH